MLACYRNRAPTLCTPSQELCSISEKVSGDIGNFLQIVCHFAPVRCGGRVEGDQKRKLSQFAGSSDWGRLKGGLEKGKRVIEL